MNTRLIKDAIREMDREMNRRYGCDEVPGEALPRSMPKVRGDRRRARDQGESEEYQWTAASVLESVRDMVSWLDDEERAKFLVMLSSADLGSDEPPLSERPTPRPGGELRSANDSRLAYDFKSRFPSAAAIEIHPVASASRTGARPMSTSASESFKARFPGAAKILNEYGR
jgi:hypothetical protein